MFNTHTGSKKFHSLDMLIAGHPFFRFHSTARDNGLDTVQYYRTLKEVEKKEYKYYIHELQDLEKVYNNFKSKEEANLRAPKILDFQDMIEIYHDMNTLFRFWLIFRSKYVSEYIYIVVGMRLHY